MPISEQALKSLRAGEVESLTSADCAEIVAELDAAGASLERIARNVRNSLQVEVAVVSQKINMALQIVSASVADEVNTRMTANQKIMQAVIDFDAKFKEFLTSITQKV